LLRVIPPFDATLHYRLFPPLRNCYGAYVNEIFELTLGELAVIATYLIVSTIWISYSVLEILQLNNHPVNVLARIFGQLVLMNTSIILFPVARNSIWLYIFGIPFERAIKYHRWVSTSYYVCMCLHFILICVDNGIRMTPAYPWSLNYTTGSAGSFGFVVFGFIAWVCFTFMIALTLVRRRSWELFQSTHLIFGTLGIIAASIHHYHYLILIAIAL
jgi:ferric-chelate reductase